MSIFPYVGLLHSLKLYSLIVLVTIYFTPPILQPLLLKENDSLSFLSRSHCEAAIIVTFIVSHPRINFLHSLWGSKHRYPDIPNAHTRIPCALLWTTLSVRLLMAIHFWKKYLRCFTTNTPAGFRLRFYYHVHYFEFTYKLLYHLFKFPRVRGDSRPLVWLIILFA